MLIANHSHNILTSNQARQLFRFYNNLKPTFRAPGKGLDPGVVVDLLQDCPAELPTRGLLREGALADGEAGLETSGQQVGAVRER